jgi:hypothetical protein
MVSTACDEVRWSIRFSFLGCTEIYIILKSLSTNIPPTLTGPASLVCNVPVEDRILEIVAELARIEERRRALLAELERLSSGPTVAARRRQLIAEIVRAAPEQRSLFELPRDYNMLGQIRRLLGSQPRRKFSATNIKAELQIPVSVEKTFYAALAKLANKGQIRRVGRAIYQAARPGAPRGKRIKAP